MPGKNGKYFIVVEDEVHETKIVNDIHDFLAHAKKPSQDTRLLTDKLRVEERILSLHELKYLPLDDAQLQALVLFLLNDRLITQDDLAETKDVARLKVKARIAVSQTQAATVDIPPTPIPTTTAQGTQAPPVVLGPIPDGSSRFRFLESWGRIPSSASRTLFFGLAVAFVVAMIAVGYVYGKKHPNVLARTKTSFHQLVNKFTGRRDEKQQAEEKKEPATEAANQVIDETKVDLDEQRVKEDAAAAMLRLAEARRLINKIELTKQEREELARANKRINESIAKLATAGQDDAKKAQEELAKQSEALKNEKAKNDALATLLAEKSKSAAKPTAPIVVVPPPVVTKPDDKVVVTVQPPPATPPVTVIVEAPKTVAKVPAKTAAKTSTRRTTPSTQKRVLRADDGLSAAEKEFLYRYHQQHPQG